jgi:hypothetical protein
MQGFTLSAAKVDLNMNTMADPVTGYIALSRVKRAEHILIMQAFDISLFQQGAPRQPDLMLIYLEETDFAAFFSAMDVYTEDVARSREQEKLDAQRSREQEKIRYCCNCGQGGPMRKGNDRKSMNRCLKKRRSGEDYICEQCQHEFKDLLRCVICKVEKSQSKFSSTMWNRRVRKRDSVCLECTDACTPMTVLRAIIKLHGLQIKTNNVTAISVRMLVVAALGEMAVEPVTSSATLAELQAMIRFHKLSIDTTCQGVRVANIRRQVANALGYSLR